MDEHAIFQKAMRERCYAARKKLGLSYRQAGKATGLPFNTIARIESGAVAPTTESLAKLAKGYGVTLKSLLCGD